MYRLLLRYANSTFEGAAEVNAKVVHSDEQATRSTYITAATAFENPIKIEVIEKSQLNFHLNDSRKLRIFDRQNAFHINHSCPLGNLSCFDLCPGNSGYFNICTRLFTVLFVVRPSTIQRLHLLMDCGR